MEAATRHEIGEKCYEILQEGLAIIQLNYKSGISVKIAVHSFSIDNGVWQWQCANAAIAERVGAVDNVLDMGAENIESVFQLKSYAKSKEIITLEDLTDAMTLSYHRADKLKEDPK